MRDFDLIPFDEGTEVLQVAAESMDLEPPRISPKRRAEPEKAPETRAPVVQKKRVMKLEMEKPAARPTSANESTARPETKPAPSEDSFGAIVLLGMALVFLLAQFI